MAESLRLRARVRSTHFSTRIEGNRLTLLEAEQAVLDGRQFPGRERDSLEDLHCFQALEQVESWVEQGAPIREERIRKLHAVIYAGKRARPTLYRDGQNAVRDGRGRLVYLPPEAKDVPALMSELIAWIQQAEGSQPVPVIAALAHDQFVTIHLSSTEMDARRVRSRPGSCTAVDMILGISMPWTNFMFKIWLVIMMPW